MTTIKPKFEMFSDAKRFFIDAKGDDGEDTKMMIRLRSSCVVITTQYGDKVAFTKTNRGENYRDSRGKKVEKKDAWGEKITKIVPLMITESQVKDELRRLLDDAYEAQRAFDALQV